MKVKSRLITTLLTLTCIVGLTACGNKDTEPSALSQQKIDLAIEQSTPIMESVIGICGDENLTATLGEYNNVELATRFAGIVAEEHDNLAIEVEGKAIRNAVTSFTSAKETLGDIDITMMGKPTYTVDDTIIVDYPVTTELGTGSVELIYSNDIYLVLESCTLNLNESMGQLMERAALNTLLGMGTVFVVLILISIIISAFSVIPKIQENLSKKNNASEKKEAVDHTIAQIIEKEELADDSELVAVIAAAIAAYEGTSTEGFVVRSIKRAKTNKWNRA